MRICAACSLTPPPSLRSFINYRREGAMNIITAPRVLAVVCTGLYTGIILGDRMGASYARPALSVTDFIRLQQIQHVHFKPLLLPPIVGAVLGGLIWIWLLRSRW